MDITAERKKECVKCPQRTKMRTSEELKALTARLNRIEGQIKGIRGMLEKNAYCTDILIQVSAATAALNSFTKELLSTHIRGCVAEHLRKGDETVVTELVDTMQRLMR